MNTPIPEEHSGYLTVHGHSIYTTLYLPGANARAAIAFAEPFGEERRPALRLFVRLARHLARMGFAVARCDFSGTGDSPAPDGEAIWHDWADELLAVLQEVQTASGASRRLLLGARAGALTAAAAAARLGDCQALLLVEPFLNGGDLLRERRRREQLKGLNTPKPASGEEFAGFPVSSDMQAEIAASDILRDTHALPDDCRLLVLRVSGLPKFPPAWQPLLDLCHSHRDSKAAILRDKPFWGQTDYFESPDVIEAVSGFLQPELS